MKLSLNTGAEYNRKIIKKIIETKAKTPSNINFNIFLKSLDIIYFTFIKVKSLNTNCSLALLRTVE